MSHRARQTFLRLLDGLQGGRLVIREPSGRELELGDGSAGPTVVLQVHDERLYSRLLGGGALGLGESFVEGWWDVEGDRVVDLMALIHRSDLRSRVQGNPMLRLALLFRWLATLPTRRGSRRNVEFHYDTGNDFFELILDPAMSYSCGYQCREDDSLEQMQAQKYELICRKLELQEGDRLVDIGCGWGGLLIYAARHYGVHGLGVTLSSRQREWALRRIAEEGLSDVLEIELRDYRETEGTFDKFVSVGMFEHVGRRYHRTFMHKMRSLLRDGGIGLLHTIGSTRSRYPGPWLRKYIFPGTYLPGLADLVRAVESADLRIGHVENLKPHYAETARHWKENLQASREGVEALEMGHDPRFYRVWDYFFQLLEGSFRYGDLQVYQVLFHRGYEWGFRPAFDFTEGLAREPRSEPAAAVQAVRAI